jgi:hypothetical protein
MSLQDWFENSWLTKTAPTARGVQDLLAIADRHIADAGLEGMSADGRFDHAYEAVRTLCQAGLYASGFAVAKGGDAHQRVLDSLKLTVGGDVGTKADYFDQCRRLRHKTMYERADVVQRPESDKLLTATRELRDHVWQWLQEKHSDLVRLVVRSRGHGKIASP